MGRGAGGLRPGNHRSACSAHRWGGAGQCAPAARPGSTGREAPSGRLPRAVVRQVQEQRPHWYLLDRPAHIEDDLPPLAALHGLLRKVGLLRLRAGVLSPTRAAGDDLETVRRLRSWFVPEEFTDILVGVTVAVLASRGPQGMD